MKISTKGRYSLEAVLLLALNTANGTDAYLSTRQISRETGISEGYLEQLFILLRKSGIIQGIRGAQGGYFLEREPCDITIGEILRTAEASLKPVPCVEENYCPIEGVCTTHGTWAALYKSINEFIDSLTIADLVADYKKNSGGEYII
ncbi:Rrf2 family transcriptional regulator [Spirochaetia bacterium]|nr:Rrf2 family transcriptional regulator [Spirochaetia bacterium]